MRDLFDHPQIEVVEAAVCRSGLAYFSGITLALFAPAARERLFALLDRARAAGVRIAFDTNFRPHGWPDPAEARHAFDRSFAASDIVLASVEDHGLLYGTDDPHAVTATLAVAGVAEAVVKCAHPACHIIAAGRRELVVADPVPDVVDTTAAGDSFAAGYLAHASPARRR